MPCNSALSTTKAMHFILIVKRRLRPGWGREKEGIEVGENLLPLKVL